MTTIAAVPVIKQLTLLRALLMYAGVAAAGCLWLLWYVKMRESSGVRYNMGPMVLPLSPILSIPLFAATLGFDRLAFRRFRGFKRSSGWLFLGLAYGSFWSCYPLTFILPSPNLSLTAAAAIAIGLALSVHLIAGDHSFRRNDGH